eukprot:GHRR01031648.1.p1 GENE.GHRR01031648.1~~GHRR01031648.1.p1  ORF type:complete len:152 (-),score=38.88 GHRR01031648.1:294-749(-)
MPCCCPSYCILTCMCSRRCHMQDGTRITFSGKGDELAPGGPAADLVFVVKQTPHPQFDRKGNDLYTSVKLPLVSALTGGKASVRTPDGRNLTLVVKPPVSPGKQEIVVGEGMPISKEAGKKGDLHVKYDVVFPTRLTEQQKEQLRTVLPAQ